MTSSETSVAAIEALFSCTDLRLKGGDRDRLHIPELSIYPGVTAVLGYSGAGKTSLLNLLAGFEEPDFGSVLRSWESAAPGFDTRAHSMPLFWSPQNGGLWSHLTAEQHVQLTSPPVTAAHGQPAVRGETQIFTQRTEYSDELLAEFDLLDRKRAMPAELSQGERSRLAVARALAAQSAVVILDEPLAHVDPARKPRYWQVILKHVQRTGATVVFSSHEPDMVLRAATTVICLHAGRVIFQGETRRLLEDPPDQEAAQLLGPVNWFSELEDPGRWISQRTHRDDLSRAIRPHVLRLVADPQSGLSVTSVMDCGLYCETIVEHVASGERRTMVHGHGDWWPSVGMHVKFELNDPVSGMGQNREN